MSPARPLVFTSLAVAAVVTLVPGRAGAACEQILISATRGQGAKSATRVEPLRVASAAAGAIRPRTYSASGIEDLSFRVRSKELPAGALLELRLEMPGGHHYQTLAAPLAFEALAGEPTPKTQRVDGYPFPLEVRAPRRVAAAAGGGSGVLEVPFTLPVAGTTIVSSSLYGEWRVTPMLDGKSCGPSLVFALDP
jgi:hypothetical protein